MNPVNFLSRLGIKGATSVGGDPAFHNYIVKLDEAGQIPVGLINSGALATLLTDVAKNKGALDCSTNPNYPTALNGDFYRCSVAGKIGGASGVVVEVADLIMCVADNAGGSQASVGTSWIISQANITGITAAGLAMLQAADADAQAVLLESYLLSLAGGTMENGAVISFVNGGSLRANPNGAGIDRVCIAEYVERFKLGNYQILQPDGVTIIHEHRYVGTIPTTTDDSTLGYVIGSYVILMSTSVRYRCTDATATAAVWVLDSTATDVNPAGAAISGALGGKLNTSDLDTDGTLAANSDTKIASQKATRTYVASVLAGVAKNKGALDCSTNPNYPTALNGDFYRCSVAGKIGGASGTVVEVADLILCIADNAGGTQASVGTSWIVGQANITGITAAGLAMLQAADASAQAALLAAALATYFSPSIVPYDSGNLTGSVTLAIGNGGTQYGTQTGNITIQPPSGTPVAMVSKIELYVTGNGSTLDFDAAVIRASDSATTFPKTLTNGLVYLLQLRYYKSQWNLVSLVGGT